jgi:hypothetical protein
MSPLAKGYLFTAVGSAALLLAAHRRPRLGRVLFALLFGVAAIFNAATAIRTPEVYVEGFAPHAIRPMREFIERVVALAPDAFVLAVAAGQLLVALALAFGRGLTFALGVAGAAAFLVGISWLGVGSAFPLNLVLAAGVLLLLRQGRP